MNAVNVVVMESQTVNVTAVNDVVVEGGHTSTITHTATSGDTSYNAIMINDVIANIADNDSPGACIVPEDTCFAVIGDYGEAGQD